MAASSEAPERGPGLSCGRSAVQSELRWRREFPGEERQLAELRRWLEALLPACQERDDVAAVATELGTNAVRHSASGQGGSFAVELTQHQQMVRVAVADDGAPGEPRVIDDPAGEHGRGLLVVQGLSVRTGVCGDHRSRLVWADIPWDGAGVAELASAQNRYEAVIRDGQDLLASRFDGTSTWFGGFTLQWWALAGGGLVTAPSAAELASLLGTVLDPAPARLRAAANRGYARAGALRTARRPQRAAVPVLRSSPQGNHLPQSDLHITRVSQRGDLRATAVTSAGRQCRAGALGSSPELAAVSGC